LPFGGANYAQSIPRGAVFRIALKSLLRRIRGNLTGSSSLLLRFVRFGREAASPRRIHANADLEFLTQLDGGLNEPYLVHGRRVLRDIRGIELLFIPGKPTLPSFSDQND